MGVRETRIGYVLKRAQGALRRAIDDALDEHDLSMAQFALLSSLQHDGPLTNAELARRSFVTPQTSIRILSDLEDADFVERYSDPHNRRRLLASLTTDGRRRLQSAEATINEVEERMLNGLSEQEKGQFRSMLERSATNLEQPPTAKHEQIPEEGRWAPTDLPSGQTRRPDTYLNPRYEP